MTEGSTFPPTLWAGVAEKQHPTTTNGCESFHSHSGNLFEKRKKPSIKTFLNHLECQTAMGEIKMRDTESKQKPVHVHHWLNRQLLEGVIDSNEFLNLAHRDMLPPKQ